MVRTEGTGETRIERDSLAAAEVPAARLWDAQTQRALAHFVISTERMPPELIHAPMETRAACARVNMWLGLVAADKAEATVVAANEVIGGLHAVDFPLAIRQTGSASQTNVNLNEVLADRASDSTRTGGEIRQLLRDRPRHLRAHHGLVAVDNNLGIGEPPVHFLAEDC
jgi:fumarate hydratase class II